MYKRQLAIILLALSFGLTSSAFCYEVVKAKTVVPDKKVPDGIRINVKNLPVPESEDIELPNYSQSNSLSQKIEKKMTQKLERLRRNKSYIPAQDAEIEEEEVREEEIVQDEEISDEIIRQKPKKVVNSDEEIVKDKNRFQVNADSMTYNEEDGNLYANGHVEIISKEHDVILKSDDAILENATQTLKLYGNVKVIKDGIEMFGEYLLVDLNEENILMDNPLIEAYSFIINAQEAHLIDNDIQAVNGTVKSMKDSNFTLETIGFTRLNRASDEFLDARKRLIKENAQDNKRQSYRVEAKEIVFTSYKDHNSMVLKNSDVYFNSHKILRGQDIEIISNKENTVNDFSAPEMATIRAFGAYIGYGFVKKLPKGQVLKIMPALTYGDENWGVGVIGRYKTPNSYLQAGWNTSTSNLVALGLYKFSDNFKLRYGRNTYIPEGFFGARRSGYAAQFEYQKGYYNSDLNLGFNHGFYAGFFTEYKLHKQEDAYATTRFRYMAQINKELLKYKNEEQDLDIQLSALAQGAATLYGSGYTHAVARIGPMLTTRLKRWESTLAYLLTGTHGDSPFWFDKYRYGKSTIMLNERLNICDKLSVGYRAFVTPMKDNIESKLLTESRFYVIFGPKDLKIAVSYDFIRSAGYLDLMLLFGGDSSKIDFKKMITQNADGGAGKRDFYKAKRVKIQDPDLI